MSVAVTTSPKIAWGEYYMRLAVGALAAALVIFPFIVQERYSLHILIMILLYAYLGSCWDLLGGYTGQFSFGPSLFFGIGAYTSAVSLTHFGVTPWIGMVVGGLLSTVVALFMGYLCFQFGLRGLYFSITTLFFAEMFRILSTNFAPGQAQGIQLPFIKGNSMYYFQFQNPVPYYYIILTMLLAIWAMLYKIERSKLGYYLLAIRESEETAETLCIDAMKYKLVAISLTGFLAALGGTFYSQYVLFIDPELAFGVGSSVEMIIRPIAGGMGTILGPFVGSLLLTPIAELTRWIMGGSSGIHLVLYGLILIAVILLMPSGVVGWIQQTARKPR